MALKRINTDNQDLQFVQDNVETALIPLQNNPMVNGVLLKNIALTAGQDNLVPHTLGRFPNIFLIGNPGANTAVWAQPSAQINNQSFNSNVINLRCTVTCTIALWIN